MQIKIVNRTHYRDDDLRAFITAGIRAEGDPERAYTVTIGRRRHGGRNASGYAYYHSGRLTVRLPVSTVERDGSAWDAAHVKRKELARRARKMRKDYSNEYVRDFLERNRDRFGRDFTAAPRLRVVTPLPEVPPESVRDAAVTLVHELMHCRGLRHRDMPPGMKRCGGHDYPTPWLPAGLRIRAKDAPAEVPREDRLAALKARREEKARADLARWEKRLRLARTKVAKYRARVRGYERRAAAATGPKS